MQLADLEAVSLLLLTRLEHSAYGDEQAGNSTAYKNQGALYRGEISWSFLCHPDNHV